ncbi:PH domain-containing protein [Streptomyces sp. NPDC051907]|uniref:PH domain-containing protein n=1 Tax=Streptomyces sp. NPDC051907 TaxID=3155284 RepID=UPI00341F09DA
MTSPQQPAEPTYADRVFRSPAAMVGGVLLLALIAWMAGDALIRGEGRTPWLALAGAIFVVPLIVAFTLRPAVFVNDERIRIRNPWRMITLPWEQVEDVRAGYSSEIFTKTGEKYQLWAVPVSLRQRKKASRRQMQRASDDPHGRTSVSADVTDAQARMASTDQTVADLRELAERAGAGAGSQGAGGAAGAAGVAGESQVRWAYEVMGPSAAGAVLLAVLWAVG